MNSHGWASPRATVRFALVAVIVLASACDESSDPDASTGGDTGVGMDTGVGTDSGGGGTCTPACEMGRDCCSSECTNLQNDPRNCGSCGVTCGTDEYCTAGACTTVPCTASCGGGEECCGMECCGAGQICCDRQGPVETGPACVTPDARGTCGVGCAPMCMCAAPDTPIATPDGDRAIADLRVGDLVYSVDGDAVVAVPIVETHRQPVSDHRVMRVTLESGVTLMITGGHPTADGRTFDDLERGGTLGEAMVLDAEEVPYPHPFTYDILPGSDTGTYYAGGTLIGSTLAP